MAYPIGVPKTVEDLLKRTTSKDLAHLREALAGAESIPDLRDEAAGISALINYELHLREVEPVSRKVARGVNVAVDYCKNNPGKVADGVATAAVAALAVSLGIDIAKKA